MNKSPKIIAILLAILLLLSGCSGKGSAYHMPPLFEDMPSFSKYEETHQRLSELSSEELFDFLLEAGLDVPKECDIPETNLKIAVNCVKKLEEDPWTRYETSMLGYYLLYQRISVIVNRYYGDDDPAIYRQLSINQLLAHQSVERDKEVTFKDDGKLSSLSDKDLLQELKNCGLEIPGSLNDPDELHKLIRSYVGQLEEDPEAVLKTGDKDKDALFLRIRLIYDLTYSQENAAVEAYKLLVGN